MPELVPDVHTEKPLSALKINRVGIRGIRLPPVRIGDYWALPVLGAYVDLPEVYRGAHISRIYKITYESFSDYGRLDHHLLEIVASKLLESHEGSSEADVSFRAVLIKDIPGQEFKSSRRIIGRLIKSTGGQRTLYTGVEFLVVTACPCALEVSRHLYSRPYTHNAIMKVTVLLRSEKQIPSPLELFEDYQKLLAEPSNYLNRVGEAEMVRRVVEQPRFAEDVAREVARVAITNYAQVLGDTGRVYVIVTSIEPFHEYKISVRLSVKTG